MSEHGHRARLYRERAEEYRRVAQQTWASYLRLQFFEMAERYEELARREDGEAEGLAPEQETLDRNVGS
jgi:hypothetical protein